MVKEKEPRIELEREYVVPLRREWLKVPEYKRANKALKGLKQFIARHMKIYDRDLRKVKVDIILNNELRWRGMRKPPAKIKVKAKKFDNGIVRVELVEIPKHIKFELARKEKKEAEMSKKKKEKEAEKKAVEEAAKKEDEAEKTEEEKKDEEEKKEAVKEAGKAMAKQQAKQMKHATKGKDVRVQRKALVK